MQQAKLFQEGQHQAVLLSEEFQLAGNSVTIKRVGKAIVLLPCNEPWSTLFDSLAQFSSDFMDECDPQPVKAREEF